MSLINQYIKWIGIGLALGLLTLAGLTIFTRQMVIEFAAILLAVIAAIYIGFALSDGREVEKRLEVSTAVIFIIIALLGLWINPWFLILGYIGHGVWDWLHHADHIQTEVIGWYPPFCAIYDLVVGFGLIFWIV